MNIIRFQPIFSEMETLRRQVDQIFDDLVTNSHNSNQRDSLGYWKPAIELQDHGSQYLLRAILPGIDGQDLDIQVTKDAVVISGEIRSSQSVSPEAGESKESEQSRKYIHSEFNYGKFQRVIPLPSSVVNDQVGAKFEQGILTLTLPKQEAQQVVKIKLGGQDVPNLPAVEAEQN